MEPEIKPTSEEQELVANMADPSSLPEGQEPIEEVNYGSR